MDDLIESAKTGRAKCRRCGEPIRKGELRFGERVENAFGEGQATQWFHLMCAAERRPAKFAPVLSAYPEEVPDRATLEDALTDGIENPALATIRRAERAPTGRARCQHCREAIEKASVRIAVERDDDMPGASASFVHMRCARAFFNETRLFNKLHRVSAGLDEDAIEEIRAEAEN